MGNYCCGDYPGAGDVRALEVDSLAGTPSPDIV